ncbi:3-ketoacyl-CoA thiolase B [Butyriboletus roseoflavus]|nr:3-ketoacyl-CoA thiolase B [Butyriboletus roseoflavus]
MQPLQRLRQISSHLYSPSGVAALQEKRPDDVVVTMAIRSPLTKAKKGALKDTRQQAIAHSHVDPASVDDICVGTVLTPDPVYHARGAALAAGFPENVPIQVVNRFCSSGLMAVTVIANQIRSGQIEIGLAVGVESMSQKYVGLHCASYSHSHSHFPCPIIHGCFPSRTIALTKVHHPSQRASVSMQQPGTVSIPMGWTSENVAQDYNISRDVMDAYAALSFQRAEHAQKSGYFTKEIVPFNVFVNNNDLAIDTTSRRRVTVTMDDGIRYGTTKESLLKVRSAFPQWGQGRTTGGNASQITDGAAAVMMMTRRKAEVLGLTILGKHVSTAVAGVPPRVMGVGPAFAIPVVLKNTGLDIADVDLFEVYQWGGQRGRMFTHFNCRSMKRSLPNTSTVSKNSGSIQRK